MAKSRTKAEYFAMGGGLDLVSPAGLLKPGALLAACNYEPYYGGGYRRIDGYERWDGQTSPSGGPSNGISWHTFQYSGFVGGAATNSFVTITVTSGPGTGSTGVLVFNEDGYIAVTRVVGGFSAGSVFTDGTHIGTATSNSTLNVNPAGVYHSTNPELDPEYYTRQYFRSLIQPMAGTGVAMAAIPRPKNSTLGYEVIGIRGGTISVNAGTGSGWQTSPVVYNQGLFFNTGGGSTSAALPVAGQTITDGTTGATGVVYSVQLWGGSIVNNDAYGVFYLSSTTGTWSATSSSIKLAGTVVATNWTGGTRTPLLTNYGSTVRFVNWNFYATANTWATYFVVDNQQGGFGNAYELDSTYHLSEIYVPSAGPNLNTPPHWRFVEVHLNYLMLGVAGGNFYESVAGSPLNFSGFFAAEQFGVGSEITGMFSAVGPALIVTTQFNTQALLGTDPTTWTLGLIGERMGAQTDSGQKLDSVYGMSAIGVTKFSRTLTFGNFAGAVISQQVQPVLQQYNSNVNCSRIVRGSNQYRVHFFDGSFLIMFVPVAGQSNMPGVSAAQASNTVAFTMGIYARTPVAMFTDVDIYGNEQCFWVDAASDGFAFKDGVGTSFDGFAIPSYLRLAYNFVGAPGYQKFYRRADFDFQTDASFDMSYLAVLDYSTDAQSNLFSSYNNDPANAPTFEGVLNANQVTWLNLTISPQFTRLTWDAENMGVARAELQGSGTGMSFMLYNSSYSTDPFILQGYTLYSELRRLQR